MNLIKYLNFAILLLGWGCATTDNATYEYDPSGPPLYDHQESYTYNFK